MRRGAWQSFSAGLRGYNHTYAATFATEVNKSVVMGRLCGCSSTKKYRLQAHKISQAVERDILQMIQAEPGAGG